MKRPPITVPRPSILSPAASSDWPIFLPVMSLRARNMPVDSIITTIMTSVMVTISTGSKIGVPKWNGGINANHCAAAIFS